MPIGTGYFHFEITAARGRGLGERGVGRWKFGAEKGKDVEVWVYPRLVD